jgi:hypothetical protein
MIPFDDSKPVPYHYFLIPFMIGVTMLMIMAWLSFYKILQRPDNITRPMLGLGLGIAVIVSLLWVLTMFFEFYGFNRYEIINYRLVFTFLTVRLILLSIMTPISWIDVKGLFFASRKQDGVTDWQGLIGTSGTIACGATLMFLLTIFHIFGHYKRTKFTNDSLFGSGDMEEDIDLDIEFDLDDTTTIKK